MSISEPTTDPSVRPGLFRRDGDDVHLLAGECDRCHELTFPAASVCPRCQQPTTALRPLASEGVVYSYTVVRARPPGYGGPVPYGLGLVDLPDGLRVFSMLLHDETAPVGIGDRVRCVEVTVGGEDGPATSYAFGRVRA